MFFETFVFFFNFLFYFIFSYLSDLPDVAIFEHADLLQKRIYAVHGKVCFSFFMFCSLFCLVKIYIKDTCCVNALLICPLETASVWIRRYHFYTFLHMHIHRYYICQFWVQWIIVALSNCCSFKERGARYTLLMLSKVCNFFVVAQCYIILYKVLACCCCMYDTM
jgi:hypothetical protein